MIEDLKNEIWKDVVGYEGFYLISNIGRLKTVHNRTIVNTYGKRTRLPERLHIPFINSSGYYRYALSKHDISKHHKAHRLIAKAFIPNPYNLPYINHINGIKTDNRIENLEWCTASHNVRHYHSIGLKSHVGAKNPAAICVLQTSTGLFFETVRDAASAFNIDYSFLCASLRGGIKNGKVAKNKYDLVAV